MPSLELNCLKIEAAMAKQGRTGAKKDSMVTSNLIMNSKENTQLSIKLASLEIQQRKEMAKWEREKNKLILPSLQTNCGRVSLTPPSSPTSSTLPSPVLRRRKSDVLAGIATSSRAEESLVILKERSRGNPNISTGSDNAGLRRCKSSQNIRLSVSPQPPAGSLVSTSPKLLQRRSTMGQACLYNEGATRSSIDTGRRFSADVVPSIRVEDSTEMLSEKVKKFNEGLKKFCSEANHDKCKETDTNSTDEDQIPNEELSIISRPITHRWKSLPSIFPLPDDGGKSNENMTFYEDMKRCKYLRIPDCPALTIEQIFNKDTK